MSDPVTPEEVEFWQNVDAITELVRKHGGDSRAIAQEAVSLAAQLEAAQKVIEAARELDWDSYAEGQGKPEVDLSGLWDALAAYDEQVKRP